MARRYKRSKIRRRSKMSASNVGPVMALLGTILGILAVAALIAFVALPQLLPLVGVEYNMPWLPTPSPQPTARPTPTPHPIIATNPTDLQTEVVMTGESYRWFADPYAYGNQLIFVGGRLVDSDIHMDALYAWDMTSNSISQIEAPLEYQDYVYPVCNGRWLVYMDSMAGGGGAIRAMRRDTGDTVLVKRVYTGQPRLHLDGDYVAWVERTGTNMDKLFMTDLNTLENVAVATFSSSAYGQSDISLSNGELIYAYEDSGGDEPAQGQIGTSGIYSVNLKTGAAEEFFPNTYVHDPETNGTYWVWRDALHGEGNSLYVSKGASGTPRRLAEDVIEYGISDSFVAYRRFNESIHIYLFERDVELAITPDIDFEKTQLLGVSNGVVIWMDVTVRDRDIMKYARID